MEYSDKEDGTPALPSSLHFGCTMSCLHSISRQFDLCAADSRVRRNRPCSPSFFSGREKCQEKPPPQITSVLSRNHPPPWCGRNLHPLHMGVSRTYPITLLRGKFLHPLAIKVPLQIETTLSKSNLHPQKLNFRPKLITPKELLRSGSNSKR